MEDKKIYIFDMDDTLIETPGFAEFIDVENGKIITDNEDINKHIQKLQGVFLTLFFKELCFEKSGNFVVALDCKTKKPFGSEQMEYIQELTPEKLQNAGFKNSLKKELLRAFDEESGVLVLKPYAGFYDDVETLGSQINSDIVSIYNRAKNKMIITGRGEKMRKSVVENLKKVGISMPNFGLYLFPGGNLGIAAYKTMTIIDSIIENNWEEIHFFEDRKDWLDMAEIEISGRFPNIKFFKHLVQKNKLKKTI